MQQVFIDGNISDVREHFQVNFNFLVEKRFIYIFI
jgi:hypothetical protein